MRVASVVVGSRPESGAAAVSRWVLAFNEETDVMPIQAEAANRPTAVDPAKLLETVRRWCPAAPVEVPITLVNALIEAAASGSSGELRLALLEELVVGLAAQLCSNAK
jgi:hypothetical protein